MSVLKQLINCSLLENDIVQLEEHGISREHLLMQMNSFQQGIPGLQIDRPAKLRDGVLKLTDFELDQYQDAYPQIIQERSTCKFVPASGAASRMFKNLLSHIRKPEHSNDQVKTFFDALEKFAFYKELSKTVNESGASLGSMIEANQYRAILVLLLTEEGMNYSALPKALLLFHQYANGNRTALEEHLAEAVLYTCTDGLARIHLTISSFHKQSISAFLKQVVPKYQLKYNIKYQITLSIQHPSTDTIAVDKNNHPFRNENGQVLVRPGGHGALLSNLNKINTDLIFIKNIDNVAPDAIKSPMVRYKKAMAGILLKNQSRTFKYLNQLDELPKSINSILEEEICNFFQNSLGRLLGSNFRNLQPEQRKKYLHDLLDRPLRVCSVVRTEKVTGGGPYWVLSQNGDQSLQVVENAQLDSSNAPDVITSEYAHITDLVCGVKSYTGKKFDLMKYLDPQTGFITEKSHQGTKIKVLEHPGLWNGGMSYWNTILLEVPDTIFHPVKSVMDLLAKDHQPV